MKSVLGLVIRIALCVLILHIYCSEQSFYSDHFIQDTGFPHAEIPETLREEERNDTMFYDDLHFIRRSYYDFVQELKGRLVDKEVSPWILRSLRTRDYRS